MSQRTSAPKLTLPRSWPCRVRSALLQVVALAQYAAVYTRSWAAEGRNARVRLQATVDQLQQEVALLQAELRIKDARMACLPSQRRPGLGPPPGERFGRARRTKCLSSAEGSGGELHRMASANRRQRRCSVPAAARHPSPKPAKARQDGSGE
jgi:hypothetical protein